MTCHTCGSREILDAFQPVMWCERCGTLQTGRIVKRPTLVNRCLAFESKLDNEANIRAEFYRLGVHEAITNDTD